jgi:hypothetical protein
MSDLKLRIQTFNQLFFEFLSDLLVLFPNDRTLQMCKAGAMGYSMVDENYIVKEFMSAVKPFQDKILKKDEDYFMTHEFKEKIGGDDNTILNEINRVINIWKDPSTSQETKNVIWSYIIKIVRLGKTIKI